MSDTITLLTADEPPVSIAVSRVHLVANSKVFADMVSVAASSSPNQDSAVNVAETEKEIEPFLAVLAGDAGQKGGELEKLDEVPGRAPWSITPELEAKGSPRPLHLFTLATCAGKPELLKRSAVRALAVKTRKSQRFGASSEWKERLDSFELQRAKLAMELVSKAGEAYDVATKALSPERLPSFGDMLFRSIRDLKLADTQWQPWDAWQKVCTTKGWYAADVVKPVLVDLGRIWAAESESPCGD
ncbi:hypothetical protein JCM10213v2_000081 [Rhodosporidiobolus nylandii]